MAGTRLCGKSVRGGWALDVLQDSEHLLTIGCECWVLNCVPTDAYLKS